MNSKIVNNYKKCLIEVKQATADLKKSVNACVKDNGLDELTLVRDLQEMGIIRKTGEKKVMVKSLSNIYEWLKGDVDDEFMDWFIEALRPRLDVPKRKMPHDFWNTTINPILGYPLLTDQDKKEHQTKYHKSPQGI